GLDGGGGCRRVRHGDDGVVGGRLRDALVGIGRGGLLLGQSSRGEEDRNAQTSQRASNAIEFHSCSIWRCTKTAPVFMVGQRLRIRRWECNKSVGVGIRAVTVGKLRGWVRSGWRRGRKGRSNSLLESAWNHWKRSRKQIGLPRGIQGMDRFWTHPSGAEAHIEFQPLRHG